MRTSMFNAIAVHGRTVAHALIVASAGCAACTTAERIPGIQSLPISLTATPPSVPHGGSATLDWSAADATSCTASGGWSGPRATSGSTPTGALTVTTDFTLSCTGPGGSASKTVTVTVTPVSSRFPLHVDAGKRYLIDAQGTPFFVHGDTPWSLLVQLTREEAEQYLEDRRQKGFNTVLANLLEHYYSDDPPRNAYGDAPFTTPGDFATPNEAYFAHAAYVITLAAQKEMLVMLTPAYMGYGGGDEGWYQEMQANGAPKLSAYGTYLATRFSAFDNILWVHGGDYNPPDLDLLRAIPNAIRAVDTKWLHTFHGSRGTAAFEFLGTGQAWLDVNTIYTNSDVIPSATTEYGRATTPFFLIEAVYEGEGADEATVRQQAYHTVLSGGMGHLMGNRPIWLFDPGWESALGSRGAATLAHLPALFAGRAWWTLVPDFAGTVLTSGQAATARASDGSFVLAYVASANDLTIDLAQLSGPTVIARWYDPADGTYSTVPGSPFPATGSHTFPAFGVNSGGFADWVLVLKSGP